MNPSQQEEMLGFDNTMMSGNQSNTVDDHTIDDLARKHAAFFKNKPYYRRDTLVDIISPGLFENMDSLGPMQSLQQESMPRVSPDDLISDVLEELFGDDIFDSADDDFADATLALEPTPLDTSQMNIVDRLPLNLYNAQDHHISLFSEILSNTEESNSDQEKSLGFSQHSFTFIPCVLGPNSIPDVSRKRKHQAKGVVKQSTLKRQIEQQDEEDVQRFRPYQAKLWKIKFAELMEFKQQMGHCCVPHTSGKHPSLARWVKTQRYQYKLKIEGKESTMTDERVVVLDEHGFIWDSHGAAWQERWNELAQYKGLYGNCNVPSNYSSNPQLATWIKCQRRQRKLYFEGKVNTTTPERMAKLESLGFEWELIRGRSSKSKSIDN
jgi:hypothetical protein